MASCLGCLGLFKRQLHRQRGGTFFAAEYPRRDYLALWLHGANDMDLLNESYDIQIAKYIAKTPLPITEAVRSVLEELAERNPKAKDLDPNKFFDDRFVRQLQAENFIDSRYR